MSKYRITKQTSGKTDLFWVQYLSETTDKWKNVIDSPWPTLSSAERYVDTRNAMVAEAIVVKEYP